MDCTVRCHLKLSHPYISPLFTVKPIKLDQSPENAWHTLIKNRHTTDFFWKFLQGSYTSWKEPWNVIFKHFYLIMVGLNVQCCLALWFSEKNFQTSSLSHEIIKHISKLALASDSFTLCGLNPLPSSPTSSKIHVVNCFLNFINQNNIWLFTKI